MPKSAALGLAVTALLSMQACAGGASHDKLVKVRIAVFDDGVAVAAPAFRMHAMSVAPRVSWCASFEESGTKSAEPVCSPDGSPQDAYLPASRCLDINIDLSRDGTVDTTKNHCVGNDTTELVVAVAVRDSSDIKESGNPEMAIRVAPGIAYAGDSVTVAWSGTFPAAAELWFRLWTFRDPQQTYWASVSSAVQGATGGSFQILITEAMAATNDPAGSAYELSAMIDGVEYHGDNLVILANDTGAPAPDPVPDPEPEPQPEPAVAPVLAAVEINCEHTVTLTGSGFGAPPTAPTVWIGAQAYTPNTWSAVAAVVSLPITTAAGTYAVTVQNAAGTSNAIDLTISASDRWSPMTTVGAPAGRAFPGSAWTGSEFVVWGGMTSTATGIITGGRYNPATDSWRPTSTTGAPQGRWVFPSVWTGNRAIFWGGKYSNAQIGATLNSGARYDPAADSWAPVSTSGAPAKRFAHAAGWSGSEMLVWGGHDGLYTLRGDGGRYNPALDSWTPIASAGAPPARYAVQGVWTGEKFVIWGGFANSLVNSGGVYDPAANSWELVSTDQAPVGRMMFSMVWTGTEVVVWGGCVDGESCAEVTQSGARYSPSTRTWAPMTMSGAPSARYDAFEVWSGNKFVVWGGAQIGRSFAHGASYSPAVDRWTPMCPIGAPSERFIGAAEWSGSEFFIWGGYSHSLADDLNDGARYTP